MRPWRWFMRRLGYRFYDQYDGGEWRRITEFAKAREALAKAQGRVR